MTRIATEFFFIIFIFRFGILLSFSKGSQLFFYNCTPDASDNTNLQSDLKNLLSTLQSEAKHSNTGFANKSIDAGTQNQLYGLIMCYIDSNQDNCTDCLNVSITNATTICPNSITATFTYEWCFLHYTENFIASLNLNNFPERYLSQEIVSNSSTFTETVSDLFNLLRSKAWKEPLLYACGNETDPGINQTVYGLVQCTTDLDNRLDLCDWCLQSMIDNLTSDLMANPYKGARYSSTNCYVRFEMYPLPLLSFKPLHPTGTRNKLVVLMVISTVVGSFLFIFVAGVWFWRMQRRKQISTSSPENEDLEHGACGECRMFQLSELKSATTNFSKENKLGEGGFGSVYKGTLDGTIIAVKRLEGWSKQGFDQFKSEVELLAKLKHNNLVKLVGYCLEKNEKLLCYEYLPGGSLDKILGRVRLGCYG